MVQDLATQWIQAYPCKTKTSQETQRSLQKFLEPDRKPKVIYTDNSLEFGKACEDLSWNHCTSTPHRSETNGIAERAVRRVKEGTSAVLLQSGLNESWWADSMECYTYLRNVTDLLSDGKTPYERRFGQPFKGPIISFGSLVEYHPISAKDQSRIHQFGLTWIVPRIRSVRGGIWKGDVLVAGIEELETMDASEIYSKRLNAKEVILTEENRKIFSGRKWTNQTSWRRSGTENIRLDTGTSNTAGTTAQGHSDECRARIEKKMLEDVRGEGAVRLEEAIRRKRARPDDESGRADVAMEVAARNPIRPVQCGGSSSSLEARPEPSRRREAEEQLGGDVVRARFQDPHGVVRTAEQAQLQPREELEAALDSICKHVKELGALHVADSDVGEIFLPGRSAKLESAFSELPGAVVDFRFGWDLASTAGRQECWKTLHAERPELVIGSLPSRRHSPWIKDEREARIKAIKHLNFCCAVYRWQTERGVYFLHEHPWRASSWDCQVWLWYDAICVCMDRWSVGL